MTSSQATAATVPNIPSSHAGDDALAGMYESRTYSNAGLPELLDLIMPSERRVLDVGCGCGDNARLLQQRGKSVTGITVSPDEAEIARPFMEQVLVGNVETMELPFEPEQFDAVLLSHVLEHLVEPEQFLRRLSPHVRRGGHIYVALPNVLFYKQRIEFLLGRFRYADSGLMDRTHLRFFTYVTARELARGAGYKVTFSKALGAVPLGPLRRLAGTNAHIDRAASRALPNLFGYHILVVARRS